VPDMVGLDKHRQTSLWGIADKAKADPNHRFENLYGCLDIHFLHDGWRKLNKRSAPGVDKVDCRTFAHNLMGNLLLLLSSLLSRRYKARLVRRQYIPKPNGKKRPLGILIVADKVLQSCCAMLLSAIYEADFLSCSFGYRPGIGAIDAVKSLTATLQFGRFGYVVEADIKGFFDNLDHEWLIRMLKLRINDGAFLGLIRKWLKAGILEPDGKVINPATGTPQGGIVSPVLSNVYLHYVLDIWFERIIKPRCRGSAMLCRYADDFVCAFQYQSDAEAFYRELPERLGKFNLEVAPDKTQLHRFSRFHSGLKRRFSFLGFEFYWGHDKKGLPRVKKRTCRVKLRAAIRNFTDWIRTKRHIRLKYLMKTLVSKLRGYYNYYGMIGNYRSLCYFYTRIMGILFKWLNRRSQRASYNWKGFKEMLKRFRVPRPRIVEVRGTGRIWFLDGPC